MLGLGCGFAVETREDAKEEREGWHDLVLLAWMYNMKITKILVTLLQKDEEEEEEEEREEDEKEEEGDESASKKSNKGSDKTVSKLQKDKDGYWAEVSILVCE